MRETPIGGGWGQRRVRQGSCVFAHTVEVEIKGFVSLITHDSIFSSQRNLLERT